MKYQFCIRFANKDPNSAASKAVLDCNKIFLQQGYKDYTFTVGDNSNKALYYLSVLKQLLTFFLAIKKGSIVGIQYPLLSINTVFKYFIKLSRVKGVKFFCIIHDLESLRTGGTDSAMIKQEIENLNHFNYVIAHNDLMIKWLQQNGFIKSFISLTVFDYLLGYNSSINNHIGENKIVYAGNLIKSKFIYECSQIESWQFNVYGPGFLKEQGKGKDNLNWLGQYSPEEIVEELQGDFGLIWDGTNIEKCDEILGNYLRYNNPHKFSLYIAAGLPVIAPSDSAIGVFIKECNVGFLVNNLKDLNRISIDQPQYEEMSKNVLALREKIISGHFFKEAIHTVEKKMLQ